MSSLKAVGHVDADSYYCAAERVRYPDLRGLPVAVLGNQGACVIAKSYEMKAFGVKTGEPIWEAVKKCPDGVYVKRDFKWYETISRLMLDVIRDVSPRVEYYSIDEFFFQVIPPKGRTFEETAVMIRDRVAAECGVPVTVGIARTRTLAKLISDTAKPEGAQAVLDRSGEERLLSRLAVSEITGIAGRRERRLSPWGIRTCLDLANADRRLVRQLLTASGEALWWELRGEPVVPIQADRPLHKVLSRGGSLGETTSSPTVLFGWLVRNVERLIEELEYHRLVTGRVSLWVGYRDGRAGEGRASLEAPSDRFDMLLDAFRACLRRAWIPRAAADRMHLFGEKLTYRARAQRGLFEPAADRQERLAQVKREINGRIGRWALRSAATLPLRDVYRDGSNAFDICDVHGKMCF